jgi:RNA polymerase sigma-70 factor (ECF subfamily)
VNNQTFYIHEKLVEDCIKGNSKAQFKLYQQYAKAMFNLAYRFVNNREDAEDILQETFTDCFRSIGSFRFESTIGAWIKATLINHCINHLKKRKIDLQYYDTVPEPAGEDEEETEFNISEIFRGIEKLPDGYRIILTLYLLEGYDHSEISQILGISESTSKSQYSRAKDKLRRMLKNKRYG